MPRNKKGFAVEPYALDSLRPYEGNPRVIPDTAVNKVASVIESVGWRQPIVVDEAMVVIAGHTRLKAAKLIRDRGGKIPNWPDTATVPVHIASGLPDEKVAAYRLADNRTGEESSWNNDQLRIELGLLQDLSIDMSLTGFDKVELDGFTMNLTPETFQPTDGSDIGRLDENSGRVECPKCGYRWTRA